MALFPLFIELQDRKCVCIGGGAVAARKVEVLLEFGADITVICPELDTKLDQLSQSGKITVVKRKYQPEDLAGAFLAIAATPDREVNGQIYVEAVKRNIPINVADVPEECTFFFPSVVKRDKLVIGITTSGGYPAFSKLVRERIEQMYPAGFGKVVKLLGDFRRKAIMEISDPNKRKLVIGKMLNEAAGYGDNCSIEHLIKGIKNKYEVYGNEKGNQGRQP